MRAADKEVEFMEKQAVEEAEKEGLTLNSEEIKLPMFKDLQAKKRVEAQKKILEEREVLEKNVSDIEKQIQQIQRALRDGDGIQSIESYSQPKAEPPPIQPLDGDKKRKAADSDDEGEGKSAGAAGPDGKFVEFSEYDGEEEPNENKKAFTLFCKNKRKEVKKSLSATEKKNRVSCNLFFLYYWTKPCINAFH